MTPAEFRSRVGVLLRDLERTDAGAVVVAILKYGRREVDERRALHRRSTT
jgi:hypothetical protein